jgi:hypothetical protein
LVLVFADSCFAGARGPLDEVMSRFPRSHLLGCSTAGEILGTTVSDGSIVVAAVRFSDTYLTSTATPLKSASDSFGAGARIARSLLAPRGGAAPGRRLGGVLLLSDGLNVNGSELVRGLASLLPPEVVVCGGLAADGDRFRSTWVLHDGAPRTSMVTAVGFYGEKIRVGHGSKGGWDMFGLERTVTRASGNVLYELDGKPALALYREYLGERAAGLPATALLFPLSVRSKPSGASVVRTILSIDEANQSLTFAGDVPEGSLAMLMRANSDRLVQGASEAAELAARDVGSNTTLSIAVSCVGRRLVLGERTEEEVEATLEHLPRDAEQVGFYSYGEISPLPDGCCELHNQTMTLTTLTEQ